MKQFSKLKGLFLLLFIVFLFLGCASGASSEDLSDAELFSEGFAAWFFSSAAIAFDDEYGLENSDFSGTVEESEPTSSGSISYSNVYSEPNSTFTSTFNNYNPDPTQFSSDLSGTLTTVTDTTDNSSTTTGTLYYAGDPMVFDISSDGTGNSNGSITYRGTAYPME